MAASLSADKWTSASSKSACGKGNSPRAAAERAVGGALPEIIDWTTGLVDATHALQDQTGRRSKHREVVLKFHKHGHQFTVFCSRDKFNFPRRADRLLGQAIGYRSQHENMLHRAIG